jgi:hypothetical protein
MNATSYIVANIWLAAGMIAPYRRNIPSKSIWAYPQPLCVVVAVVVIIAGWAS